MTLCLRTADAVRIHAHLCRAYPEEGCGLLVGRDEGTRRVVERVVESGNRGEGAREQRYVIAPEDVLAAEREARDAGLDVVGFFHSHPDRPALPSVFDLEHAWPYYSYLIVSIEQGRVGEVRAWRLAADRSRFEPEAIEPPPAAGSHAPGAGPEES